MNIVIPKTCPHDHDQLRDLIAYAMDEAESVEVHVKSRHPKYVWKWRENLTAYGSDGTVVHGRGDVTSNRKPADLSPRDAATLRRVVHHDAYWCSGRAYGGIPGMANVSPSVRYLVTLTIPTPDAYDVNVFPYDHVYPGKRSSSRDWPHALFERWEHDVVHTAAHEARHVIQFATGAPGSEMDAERYARERLAAWL